MKKVFLLSAFLFLCLFSFAKDDCIPDKPSLVRLVNNFSDSFPNFISEEEKNDLEQKLQTFSNETSNQISIVIVDDMCGFEAPEFSFRLFDKWGIGQHKRDNGILIIIKPTGGAGNRDEGIVVGRGLEGAIPDAVAGKITRQEMIPFFRQKKYYEGLDAAVNVLMALAKGEYNSNDYADSSSDGGFRWIYVIFFVIVVIIIAAGGRKGGGTTIGSGRTYYGGGWSSWGGGGFGGGSSGGGGFGGFGGGSTGGGGSFGKW